MRATVELEQWPLRESFGIARGVSTEGHALRVVIERDGIRAQGEAEAAEYEIDEARARARECQSVLDALPEDCSRAELQARVPAGTIRNAIDCALWDLESKRRGLRAWEIAGIEPGPVRTLYTIALDTPEVMARRAREHADWPWLKVKLGGGAGDSERLAAVKAAAPAAKLLVDANGGWTRADLDRYAPEFAALGVSVIEQPLPPGADAALADWNGPLPLCADESCTDRASLARLAAGYRLVNIKLDKCGGLTEALELARAARERGLGVMVGCNLGTSLAMAPAMLIARLAEVVDLDGPLLLAADRTPPLHYDRDLVHWPDPALWG
jgi:L-alanine-DL-glutamate epimerase-like enolase superfamily enzyme